MDKEAEALLDLDIADHLIESLDAARRARWEESPARMHFTHSSQKSWALLRRLGAAQRPPQSARPPVSANKVASRLIQVTKAPANKAFKRKVCRRMAPGTSNLCNRASSSGNIARRSGQCLG